MDKNKLFDYKGFVNDSLMHELEENLKKLHQGHIYLNQKLYFSCLCSFFLKRF